MLFYGGNNMIIWAIIYVTIGFVIVNFVFDFAEKNSLITDQVRNAATPSVLIIVSLIWPILAILVVLNLFSNNFNKNA